MVPLASQQHTHTLSFGVSALSHSTQIHTLPCKLYTLTAVATSLAVEHWSSQEKKHEGIQCLLENLDKQVDGLVLCDYCLTLIVFLWCPAL